MGQKHSNAGPQCRHKGKLKGNRDRKSAGAAKLAYCLAPAFITKLTHVIMYSDFDVAMFGTCGSAKGLVQATCRLWMCVCVCVESTDQESRRVTGNLVALPCPAPFYSAKGAGVVSG